MRFFLTNGSQISYNINKHKIDWDTPVSRGKFGKLQFSFKTAIRPFWEKHFVYEEFSIPKSRKSIDFINLTLRIAVEIQGKQHTEYNEFFHGNMVGYYNQKMRDLEKAKFCEMNNFNLVEIFEGEDINEGLLKSKGLI